MMVFDYTNLDKIEQVTITLANEARQIRLEMLERGLNEFKEDLLFDLLAEFGNEEMVIKIAEVILGW